MRSQRFAQIQIVVPELTCPFHDQSKYTHQDIKSRAVAIHRHGFTTHQRTLFLAIPESSTNANEDGASLCSSVGEKMNPDGNHFSLRVAQQTASFHRVPEKVTHNVPSWNTSVASVTTASKIDSLN